MTRQYTKKANHWAKRTKLQALAAEQQFEPKVQKSKGQLIKALRESACLSQGQLGDLIGKSDDGVYRLESAKARITPELEESISRVIAERIELSYVAGLFDRRSVFTIYKAKPASYNCRTQNGYEVRIIFNTTHKLLVDLMVSLFGAGKVFPRKNPNGAIGWCFNAFTKDAEVVLDKLIPYLKIKRPLAELMLELRDLQNSSNCRWDKSGNQEYLDNCEKIYQKFLKKKEFM